MRLNYGKIVFPGLGITLSDGNEKFYSLFEVGSGNGGGSSFLPIDDLPGGHMVLFSSKTYYITSIEEEVVFDDSKDVIKVFFPVSHEEMYFSDGLRFETNMTVDSNHTISLTYGEFNQTQNLKSYLDFDYSHLLPGEDWVKITIVKDPEAVISFKVVRYRKQVAIGDEVRVSSGIVEMTSLLTTPEMIGTFFKDEHGVENNALPIDHLVNGNEVPVNGNGTFSWYPIYVKPFGIPFRLNFMPNSVTKFALKMEQWVDTPLLDFLGLILHMNPESSSLTWKISVSNNGLDYNIFKNMTHATHFDKQSTELLNERPKYIYFEVTNADSVGMSIVFELLDMFSVNLFGNQAIYYQSISNSMVLKLTKNSQKAMVVTMNDQTKKHQMVIGLDIPIKSSTPLFTGISLGNDHFGYSSSSALGSASSFYIRVNNPEQVKSIGSLNFEEMKNSNLNYMVDIVSQLESLSTVGAKVFSNNDTFLRIKILDPQYALDVSRIRNYLNDFLEELKTSEESVWNQVVIPQLENSLSEGSLKGKFAMFSPQEIRFKLPSVNVNNFTTMSFNKMQSSWFMPNPEQVQNVVKLTIVNEEQAVVKTAGMDDGTAGAVVASVLGGTAIIVLVGVLIGTIVYIVMLKKKLSLLSSHPVNIELHGDDKRV